jgi:hypothetical protein
MLELLLPLIGKIFDRVLPDQAARDSANLEILKLAQSGELAQLNADTSLALKQGDINIAEASSASLFKGGWRPFIGWVCGTGLATQFLVAPLATWSATLLGHPIAFPPLDMGTLLTLLSGMLGLGVMRTAEKIKGTK